MSREINNKRLSYLIELYCASKFAEIRDTWNALGAFEVDSNTKSFIKDTIVKIKTPEMEVPRGLQGALLYIRENYIVKEGIDWASLEKNELTKHIVNSDNITSPVFYVLLDFQENFNITQPINEDYEPFEFETKRKGFAPTTSEVIISDEELYVILNEVGVPFLDFNELEYSKETLCNLCIKPALQRYYREFPIIERVTMGTYGPGQLIDFPLPPNCTGIKRAQFQQGGGSDMVGGMNGVFAFANLQYTMSGSSGGGKFGRGIRYNNKQVPGYTGAYNMDSRVSSYMGRQTQQAITNLYKRQRLNTYIDENGEKRAKGYSSIGGSLDVEFKYWDNNWDNIEFDELEYVRMLATAKVMRSLVSIRTLIQTGVEGSIDFSGYNSRADKLEETVYTHWKERPKVAIIRA